MQSQWLTWAQNLQAIAQTRLTYAQDPYDKERYTAVKLLAIYDRNQHPHPPIPWHTYKLFFLCQLTGGTPTHSLETNGVGFFREDDLPPLSISRITVAQITRMFEYARHPDWPTDFD